MHVVLAYHSLRRRRGCHAGYGMSVANGGVTVSCKAGGGANVLFGMKKFLHSFNSLSINFADYSPEKQSL